MFPLLAAALLATTVAATGVQIYQARKAEKKNEAAQEAQNRIQARRSQRERLDQLRRARVAAAEVSNTGAALGMGAGTSGFEGQVASVGAQYGANVAYANSNMRDASEAAFLAGSAARDTTRGATISAIGQLAMAGFTQFGGAGALTSTPQPTGTPTPPLPTGSDIISGAQPAFTTSLSSWN